MSALTTRRPQQAPHAHFGPSVQGAGAPQHQAGAAKAGKYGNEFMKDKVAAKGDKKGEKGDAKGPFGSGWLNDALGAAFGVDLGGLEASFGEGAQNEAIGAEAHTRGKKMSFGAAKEDPSDPDAIETIAHETAHALAGGGSGQTAMDRPGDTGEHAADHAGKRFRQWAESDFKGPAPKLKPAKGGKAAVHRRHTSHASSSSTVDGSPLLERGSRGSLVEALQRLLNAHGAHLRVDGIFGDMTDNAVRDFQRDHDLEVDGKVGPHTAAALNGHATSGSSHSSHHSSGSSSGDHAVDGSPALQRGSRGSLVRTLQRLLNEKGGNLAVDGEFGSNTDYAVRGFQEANHLEVDGVVGPRTAAALNSSSSHNITHHSSGSSHQSHYAGNDAYDDMRSAVLAAARSHMGAPYYYGADGPNMFDCSGFVLYVLRQDTGLINWGDDTAGGIKARLPSTSNPRKGDLNFYSNSYGVQHVEMYTGSGTTEIGCSGGGEHTYGHDPNAKVQYSDMTADSRTRTHGSIAGLIEAYNRRHQH
jgi:peptidoglycan hydrolase-like protein with peptidoglycan-binding domain